MGMIEHPPLLPAWKPQDSLVIFQAETRLNLENGMCFGNPPLSCHSQQPQLPPPAAAAPLACPRDPPGNGEWRFCWATSRIPRAPQARQWGRLRARARALLPGLADPGLLPVPLLFPLTQPHGGRWCGAWGVLEPLGRPSCGDILAAGCSPGVAVLPGAASPAVAPEGSVPVQRRLAAMRPA